VSLPALSAWCGPAPTSPKSGGTRATLGQRQHGTGSTTPATGELLRANEQLSQEIEERKGAKESLQDAFAEITRLKDRLQFENIYLQQEVAREYNFGEITGQSNVLSYVLFRVEQVEPMNAPVLLFGETGTGKGVIARAVHSSSARKDRPMLTVNCTGLPANLIESEQRLKRVFHIDIETCPHCQGPLKIISCIEDSAVIHKILTHLSKKAPAIPAEHFPECRSPPRHAR
jgi:hypothetical protein